MEPRSHPLAVTILAVLAVDELSPIQLARVEERLQLVIESGLAEDWLKSRFSPLPAPSCVAA